MGGCTKYHFCLNPVNGIILPDCPSSLSMSIKTVHVPKQVLSENCVQEISFRVTSTCLIRRRLGHSGCIKCNLPTLSWGRTYVDQHHEEKNSYPWSSVSIYKG
jgi:hypothetical protein